MKLKHYGQYKCQKLLNNGGFGRVYEMMDTKSEQKYAFKVIQSSFLTNAIKNEHHALKVFKDNPNFLSSYGGAQYKNEFIFKFALANGGNLKQYIQAKGVLSEKNAKKMLMQLLQQIKIAHKNSIIHNDIKPENIVLDDGNYYLIDWSSSLTEQSDYYEMVSTDYLFMTPEHYNKQVRFSTDIYMLGHILYYVLHGKLLFGLYSEMFESQMMQAHLSKVPQYDSKISMPMQNLLNGMLCKIPSKRISLEEIQNFLKTDTLTKNYAIEPLNEPLTVLDDEHTYRFYAKQNITIALFRYAIELENKDEYEKSKAIYKRLATQNYSRAMNNLGYIYNAGLGEKQDYKKAVYWYTKASKLNNSMAIYNLALMYEHAKGVESNKPYAQKLYALAAKKGYKKAIDHLQSKS